MNIIKTILVFLVSTVLGFGCWYLVFWFITNETNAFLWNWAAKVIYLLLGYAASLNIIQAIEE